MYVCMYTRHYAKYLHLALTNILDRIYYRTAIKIFFISAAGVPMRKMYFAELALYLAYHHDGSTLWIINWGEKILVTNKKVRLLTVCLKQNRKRKKNENANSGQKDANTQVIRQAWNAFVQRPLYGVDNSLRKRNGWEVKEL